MKKEKFSNQRFRQGQTTMKGVPLFITYHPLLKSLSKIIYDNFSLSV